MSYLQHRPKLLNEYLQIFGDKKIKNIQVCRIPIDKKISSLLKLLSYNKYSKLDIKYDTLYHLFSIIHFYDNTLITIEKNERVKIFDSVYSYENIQECIDIDVEKDIKFIDMIENAEKSNSYLYRYTAIEYNCQNFIYSLLKYSDLNNDMIDIFILQDIKSILTNFISNISNIATDTYASINYMYMGGGKY